MQPAAYLPVSEPGGRKHQDETTADELDVLRPGENEVCGECTNNTAQNTDGVQNQRNTDGDTTCPYDWIGHRGKCYYISEKEDNWTSSQSFCLVHGASLAIIENKEKVFVSRIKGNHPSWIGLHRDPGQPWKWTNGENSTLKVIGDGGNCAYLNDEGTASSSRCGTEHHFICSKSLTYFETE
uniref:C-type lectin domain family 2 member D-like n=1 Tax=Euleptes europaea TaxID=460621 RepID=UPI0025403FEE|nr:C-type lectin domain family 2 member D-like [Euleptes europaea]